MSVAENVKTNIYIKSIWKYVAGEVPNTIRWMRSGEHYCNYYNYKIAQNDILIKNYNFL